MLLLPGVLLPGVKTSCDWSRQAGANCHRQTISLCVLCMTQADCVQYAEAVKERQQRRQQVDAELKAINAKLATLQAVADGTSSDSPSASPQRGEASSSEPSGGVGKAAATAEPAAAAAPAAEPPLTKRAAEQQLKDVKQRRWQLHQELNQLKADVSMPPYPFHVQLARNLHGFVLVVLLFQKCMTRKAAALIGASRS